MREIARPPQTRRPANTWPPANRWPTLAQKRATFAMTGYAPFPQQFEVHRHTPKLLQLIGAEGAGKSRIAAMEISACLPWCRLIYLVGQTYDNSQTEFLYLEEVLLSLGAITPAGVSKPRHARWEMTTLTGCRIITLSVERGAASVIAKGEQPDIIALCEAGVIASYSVLLAAVRRATRVAGRVIAVGTLRDNFGWYASLFDDLQTPQNAWGGLTYCLPSWVNLSLYPLGENDPEIARLRQIMPADEFARTIAAQRVRPRSLIFADDFSLSRHVIDDHYLGGEPVTIWIDPGYYPSSYCVLAVQQRGDALHIIDEVYHNFKTHDQTIAVCKSRQWWQGITHAVIDVAGNQHRAEADKSASETWRDALGFTPAAQLVTVQHGISLHRQFLHQNRLFHSATCTNTISEYNKYKRPTDRDGNPLSDLPADADNHAMKAIAYGLKDFISHTVIDMSGLDGYRG